jgi:hypothetical protein
MPRRSKRRANARRGGAAIRTAVSSAPLTVEGVTVTYVAVGATGTGSPRRAAVRMGAHVAAGASAATTGIAGPTSRTRLAHGLR